MIAAEPSSCRFWSLALDTPHVQGVTPGAGWNAGVDWCVRSGWLKARDSFDFSVFLVLSLFLDLGLQVLLY